MPTPTQADLKAVFGLPPEEAIAYFKSKGYEISWNWRDVRQEKQAMAFTVARVMKLDVLEDIRNALDDALTNGTTLQEFEKQLTPILQAKGWWGPMIDKETGEITTYDGTSRPVELGSPRRLKTIYQTNLQTAYMAGRYASFIANTGNHIGARNNWQYIAVMDGHTRPSHAALNGMVFRWDDPIWNLIWPPNGFNCRCRVRALTDAQVIDMGLVVRSSDGWIKWELIDQKNGSSIQRPVIKLTGMDKAFSPDIGWAYNPGKAQMQALQNYATNSANAADVPLASNAIRDLVAGPVFREFYESPSGNFPIGVIADVAATQISSKTHTVILSADTMIKQISQHPEISMAEYAYIQDTFERGQIVQDSPVTLIYILEEKGYVSVIKATQSGKAAFLTSFRRLSSDEVKRDKEIQRLLEKGRTDGGASQPA